MKLFFEAGTLSAPDESIASARVTSRAAEDTDGYEDSSVRRLDPLRELLDDEWATAARRGTKPITMEWAEWTALNETRIDKSDGDGLPTTVELDRSWIDVSLPSGF